VIAAAWLIVAGYASINAVVKAELFPTKVRATGIGLPYALTVSIFGGTAESIALWCKSIGHETWFYYCLTAVIAVSLLVYVTIRDTKQHSAMGRHEWALPTPAGVPQLPDGAIEDEQAPLMACRNCGERGFRR